MLTLYADAVLNSDEEASGRMALVQMGHPHATSLHIPPRATLVNQRDTRHTAVEGYLDLVTVHNRKVSNSPWPSFQKVQRINHVYSQLSLISFHDDPRLMESMIRQPSDDMKKRHPIFCHRLELARISHKVSGVYLEATPDAVTFCNHIEEMYGAIAAWKDDIPVSV
jgi:hypothetical protein